VSKNKRSYMLIAVALFVILAAYFLIVIRPNIRQHNAYKNCLKLNRREESELLPGEECSLMLCEFPIPETPECLPVKDVKNIWIPNKGE